MCDYAPVDGGVPREVVRRGLGRTDAQGRGTIRRVVQLPRPRLREIERPPTEPRILGEASPRSDTREAEAPAGAARRRDRVVQGWERSDRARRAAEADRSRLGAGRASRGSTKAS